MSLESNADLQVQVVTDMQ